MKLLKKWSKENKNLGFTLIELLVVVAIIGLLASIVLVSLNNARIKSRDAKRITDMTQIVKAAEFFYDSQGQYPYATGGGPFWDDHWNFFRQCLETGVNCGFAVSSYQPVVSVIPNDPLDNPLTLSDADPTYYTGWENRTPNNLILRMRLENSNDPALQSDADGGWRDPIDGGCDDPWYCVKINWPF